MRTIEKLLLLQYCLQINIFKPQAPGADWIEWHLDFWSCSIASNRLPLPTWRLNNWLTAGCWTTGNAETEGWLRQIGRMGAPFSKKYDLEDYLFKSRERVTSRPVWSMSCAHRPSLWRSPASGTCPGCSHQNPLHHPGNSFVVVWSHFVDYIQTVTQEILT